MLQRGQPLRSVFLASSRQDVVALTHLLHDAGCDITLITGGLTAMTSDTAYPCPVVLLEMALLQEVGWSVVDVIRVQYREPEIVVVTRIVTLEEIVQSVGMGMADYVKLPIARAIHENSLRKEKPLVAVNCAALPDDLLESELFGYKRGAFTGAIEGRIGLVEHASGGTLFLDEIVNASCSMQTKLLRVLEEGQIRRIGENVSRPVDVRMLCAANVRLDEAVRDGRFRKDLYYRVSGFHIVLPPLRERVEDIPLLVTYYLQRFCPPLGKEIQGVTDEAMDRLLQHDWPGNVRELEHCLEAAVIVCQSSLISSDDLQLDGHMECTVGTLHRCEQEHIMQVLQACKGKKSRAAWILGISPNTLYIKLHHYGLLGRE